MADPRFFEPEMVQPGPSMPRTESTRTEWYRFEHGAAQRRRATTCVLPRPPRGMSGPPMRQPVVYMG